MNETNEIDDPIPREHAACIVRAGGINKKIINARKSMEALNLVGIEEAFSTAQMVFGVRMSECLEKLFEARIVRTARNEQMVRFLFALSVRDTSCERACVLGGSVPSYSRWLESSISLSLSLTAVWSVYSHAFQTVLAVLRLLAWPI